MAENSEKGLDRSSYSVFLLSRGLIFTTMTYKEKEVIADNYLLNECGFSWEDLPDINSLHDADTNEEIIELCNERLNEL